MFVSFGGSDVSFSQDNRFARYLVAFGKRVIGGKSNRGFADIPLQGKIESMTGQARKS